MKDPSEANKYVVVVSNHIKQGYIESSRVRSARLYRTNRHGRYESRLAPLFDIAILKLETDLTSDIRFPKVLSDKTKLTKGTTMDIVGFGQIATREVGEFEKLHAQMKLDTYYQRGNLKSLIKVFSPEGSSPCFGDSGGPLYLRSAGELYLAGIVHGVSQLAISEDLLEPLKVCESSFALYTSISDYASWLDQHISEIDLPQAIADLKVDQTKPATLKDWCRFEGINPDQQLIINQLLKASSDPLCIKDEQEDIIQLKHFEFEGLQIENVEPLSLLKGLEEAKLGYNKITDLTPLAQLPNLKQVKVDHNQIQYLPYFASVGIKSFDMSVNNISVIESLSSLSHLSELFATRNNIEDVSPLAQLMELEIVVLSKNQIVDPTPLSNLINIFYLNLSHNPLDEMECPIEEEKGDICEI